MTANPLPNNTNYPIIKGIPLPKVKSKYPFDLMEVGDCLYFPNYTAQLCDRMAANLRYFKKQNGFKTWKFTCRKIIKDGKPVLQVQREA